MSDYRIVCTTRSGFPTALGHRHIVSVGTGVDPNKTDASWTVPQVRSAMARGDRFYTVSPSTAKVANVEAYDCCNLQTLRSTPDAVADNNLDRLRLCWT